MGRTLFHWDTPLAIQLEYGGFGSPKAIDDFVHYAVCTLPTDSLLARNVLIHQEIMFKRFNGTVDTWFTFNEPGVFCGGVGAIHCHWLG